MINVLIPTKLDKAAAGMLTEKGYHVVQDADTELPILAASHPDTEALSFAVRR